MKLKEIEVGMAVVDKYGNEYKVVSVDKRDNFMPVELICTKFLKRILVQKWGDVSFEQEGESFYIYKSNKVARNDCCDVGCITVKSLKPKSDEE